jgi:F420-dependent oxidoreductase-like protein
MQIGLQIPDFTRPEGTTTLGPALAQVARTADEQGFDFITVMDHFFQVGSVGPTGNDMLEAYTTLGFLAANTTRARLMTLVTGVHHRSAGLLAKIITTLDVLSQGRAWLGIGTGWNEEESLGLGLGFPSLAERFESLEETLQICLQMWRGDETPFVGKHFQLTRPLNSPQSLQRPHPPIMVSGGGEKKSLRLVAKYADACNLPPGADVGRKLDILKRHCDREGRDYDDILKTMIYRFDASEGASKIIKDIQEYAALGIQAVIGAVRDVYTITPLETIGAEVIPEVTGL